MFRVVFHPSSAAHNTVSTVFGINETRTAACRERGWSGTLHNLLYQIAAFVLYSFLLMILNSKIFFACLASMNIKTKKLAECLLGVRE